MGYSPLTIMPPLPFSLSHQGRGAGVRGVYNSREQGVIPFRVLSGNRPYSVFKEKKHYHRRADKSSFFLEVLFSKAALTVFDKYFLLTKGTLCFIINFALKSKLLEKIL
jgi:hypothetical protein